MSGPKWFNRSDISVHLLRDGPFTLDEMLAWSAPPDAIGPHTILRVKVEPSPFPNAVRFRYIARASSKPAPTPPPDIGGMAKKSL